MRIFYPSFSRPLPPPPPKGVKKLFPPLFPSSAFAIPEKDEKKEERRKKERMMETHSQRGDKKDCGGRSSLFKFAKTDLQSSEADFPTSLFARHGEQDEIIFLSPLSFCPSEMSVAEDEEKENKKEEKEEGKLDPCPSSIPIERVCDQERGPSSLLLLLLLLLFQVGRKKFLALFPSSEGRPPERETLDSLWKLAVMGEEEKGGQS